MSLSEPIHEEFASVQGCRIRYLTGGVGLPMVLLHGLGGYSFCWRHNLSALAECCTVFALDFPGSGFSERPKTPSGSLLPLAELVLAFIAELRLEQPVLIGSSHGGAVALMAASLAAQRKIPIGPMILISPVNPWSQWGAGRAAFLGSPLGGWLMRVCAPAVAPLHQYFFRSMYGDPRRLTAETLAGYRQALAVPGTALHLHSRISQWQQDLARLEQALPACAGLPALLIWGELDRAVDPASAQPLLRALPRARLATIPGAGHLPFEESPQEFNVLAIDFLRAQGVVKR